MAGIQPQTLVSVPGKRRGHRPKKGRRDAVDAIAVRNLAIGLPAKAWHTIEWREGTNDVLSSRFARVRVRVASSDQHGGKRAKEWLLIEWSDDEDKPAKYWLSTLPKNISFCNLVDAAKLRWRIERDYQELKQEVGLGHFEGRGWRGFHHHATLCIAAYGPLISKRRRFPPQDLSRRAAPRNLPFPTVIDPAAPPLRTERHIPNSIATMRRRLINALIRRLPRCPCCQTKTPPRSQRRNL